MLFVRVGVRVGFFGMLPSALPLADKWASGVEMIWMMVIIMTEPAGVVAWPGDNDDENQKMIAVPLLCGVKTSRLDQTAATRSVFVFSCPRSTTSIPSAESAPPEAC